MMNGNNVYIFESMFDGRDVGCGSGPSYDDNNRHNIPAPGSNIVEERVVFGLFGGNSVKRESLITIGEFNVLNENIG
jgi:hypothetical protein